MKAVMPSTTIASPAEVLLAESVDFKRFVERMIAIEQIYVVKQRPGAERSVVSLQGEELDSVLPSLREQWLNLCLREYLERKTQFAKRHKNRRQLLLKIVVYIIILLSVLWYVWPLWDMIIGIEDSYYTVLGLSTKATENDIKRAYREQIKKWHPDHNPECGEECRLHVIKLRNAYDTLLSRGSKQFELINKYRENLSMLRSFVSFRLYTIAAESALGILELIHIISKTLHVTNYYNTFVGSIVCKVAVMFFFMAYEIKINGHFNIMTLINIFFFGMAMCKTSAITILIEQRKRTAYINLLLEFTVFVLPIVISNIMYLLLYNKEIDFATDTLRMIWGALYVLGFLYRFSPNLYDNMLMRKCSLSLPYLQSSSTHFSWYNFASVEFGWLLDDIFAFTCRAPSAYRVIVWVIHATYLIQFFTLPKDRPVVRHRKQSTTQNGKHNENIYAHTTSNSDKCKIGANVHPFTKYNNQNSKSNELEKESTLCETSSTSTTKTSPPSSSITASENEQTNTESASITQAVHDSNVTDSELYDDTNRNKYNNKNNCKSKVNTVSSDNKNDYINKIQSVMSYTSSSEPLSKEEEAMLTSVDVERVKWLDVCANKYRLELERCKEKFVSQYGGQSSMVDFACSDDLQYIVIVGARDTSKSSLGNANNCTSGSTKNASTLRSRNKASKEKLSSSSGHNETGKQAYSIDVLFRDYNPIASKLFAMENGPRVFYSCWFANPEQRRSIMQNYVTHFGSGTIQSISQRWQNGESVLCSLSNQTLIEANSSAELTNKVECILKSEKQACLWHEMIIYVMGITFALLLSTSLIVAISPSQIIKSMSTLPITLKPLVTMRFSDGHMIGKGWMNMQNASTSDATLLLYGTQLLLCTVDLWETH